MFWFAGMPDFFQNGDTATVLVNIKTTQKLNHFNSAFPLKNEIFISLHQIILNAFSNTAIVKAQKYCPHTPVRFCSIYQTKSDIDRETGSRCHAFTFWDWWSILQRTLSRKDCLFFTAKHPCFAELINPLKRYSAKHQWKCTYWLLEGQCFSKVERLRDTSKWPISRIGLLRLSFWRQRVGPTLKVRLELQEVGGCDTMIYFIES